MQELTRFLDVHWVFLTDEVTGKAYTISGSSPCRRRGCSSPVLSMPKAQ